MEMKSSDGETRSRPAHIVLQQEGEKITGQAGPNETDLYPLTNCKATGAKLHCEIAANEMAIDVDVEGDKMTGMLSGPSPEGGSRTAKLALQRVPPAAK
jgi:hypothetical protein